MTATPSPALAPWRDATVTPVDPAGGRHCLHSYFNTTPESPDGRWIVTFTSDDPEGHVGAITLFPRGGGAPVTLAEGVTGEDAHRQAYQQWSAGGRYVVFQDLHGGTWQVRRAEVATGRIETLAQGRQIAFGLPGAASVLMHGPPWAPGDHRDLERLDVETGQVTVAVANERVRDTCADFVAGHHGDRPTSLFFGIPSPGRDRVFFKVVSVATGNFREPGSRFGPGMVIWDLAADALMLVHEHWGHPSWSPDGERIVASVRERLHEIDPAAGSVTRLDALPPVPGTHPSYHPVHPRLLATDAYRRDVDADRGWYGVWVGDREAGAHHWVHRLDGLPDGATSWRPPHPHPAFSADGRRLYFNVSAGGYSRLHVANAAIAKAGS